MSDVIDNLEDKIKELEKAKEEFEKESAQKLLQKSQERVPVQTGRLKNSGKTKGGSVIYDAPYALEVHERAGRGFKFLEKAKGEVNILKIGKEKFNVS